MHDKMQDLNQKVNAYAVAHPIETFVISCVASFTIARVLNKICS